MLVAQAHTLDAVFHETLRRSSNHMTAGYLETAERYIKLGLKAQAQCRATLETLAKIKTPPTLFAQQANIAHGPQQVNNTASREGQDVQPTRAANQKNRTKRTIRDS